MKLIKKYLLKFIEDELYKTGLKKAVCGLSGGIDSAVVAVLAQEALGDNFKAILLPSQHSSDSSITDALALCKKFNINNETISIAPLLEAYPINDNLRKGNFSARMRMSILYDKASEVNGMVIGTSNKSELLLGYGTIFGDLASAFNPIGDLYKSEIFEFAKFLGVNEEIISKPPSADLWEGQSDEEELGYSYKVMDDVLKQLIDNGISKEQLVQNGVDEKLIDMLQYRIKANAFKGKLPTIANIDFN